MKISIVVPVYNAEPYLAECIESVLNQTNSNWELLLIDDGSVDHSLEICNHYAESDFVRIKVYHKQNEGQLLTRLYGIDRSSGEYIGFLDADDKLHREYVEQLIHILNENSDIDIICFDFKEGLTSPEKVIDIKNSNNYEKYDTLQKRRIIYEQIIKGELPGSMWSKIFKAEIIKERSRDIDLVRCVRYGEDAYHSFALMAKVDTIAVLKEELYYYRINLQGASKNVEIRDLSYFNTKFVFELLQSCLHIWGMDTPKYRDILWARNFNETVYHMLNYFRCARGFKRKKQIIEYNWTTYLLDTAINHLESNEYLRKSYIRVWNAFREKKYIEIFIRETFKKFIGW